MQHLIALATRIGAALKARDESLAVAESSTGGLISAALLAVPGASTYFLGGAVVYTLKARSALLGIEQEALEGMRPSTQPYAQLLADTVRARMGAAWGLSESGASGPTGNRYGDAPGHTCIALSGPMRQAITLETAQTDREANMLAFAHKALEMLLAGIEAS